MDPQERLAEAAIQAKEAEQRGDDGLAAAEWHRYRLIRDANRDPEELLAEGISLSVEAMKLHDDPRVANGELSEISE